VGVGSKIQRERGVGYRPLTEVNPPILGKKSRKEVRCDRRPSVVSPILFLDASRGSDSLIAVGIVKERKGSGKSKGKVTPALKRVLSFGASKKIH